MNTHKPSGTDKEAIEAQDPPDIQGLQYPVPFVADAGPDDTLEVGQDLVLVLPAFDSDRYERVNMHLDSTDLSGQTALVNVPFVRNTPTRAKATVTKPFKAGDVATLSAALKLTGSNWHTMPSSIPYTFVAPK